MSSTDLLSVQTIRGGDATAVVAFLRLRAAVGVFVTVGLFRRREWPQRWFQGSYAAVRSDGGGWALIQGRVCRWGALANVALLRRER